MLHLISSRSLLVENYLVILILISTYKTILHFYAVIIMDLIEQTPKQTSQKQSKAKEERMAQVESLYAPNLHQNESSTKVLYIVI